MSWEEGRVGGAEEESISGLGVLPCGVGRGGRSGAFMVLLASSCSESWSGGFDG